jgi:hypothetical protein
MEKFHIKRAGGKRPSRQEFLDYLQDVRKQVNAIEILIENDWLNVNAAQGIAGINPDLYTYCYEAEDYTVVFQALATMIRNYINIRRAIKTGELQRFGDEGKLEGFDEETLNQLCQQTKRLKAEDDLIIIAVNYNGVPIMEIVENQDLQYLEFRVLKEQPQSVIH